MRIRFYLAALTALAAACNEPAPPPEQAEPPTAAAEEPTPEPATPTIEGDEHALRGDVIKVLGARMTAVIATANPKAFTEQFF